MVTYESILGFVEIVKWPVAVVAIIAILWWERRKSVKGDS